MEFDKPGRLIAKSAEWAKCKAERLLKAKLPLVEKWDREYLDAMPGIVRDYATGRTVYDVKVGSDTADAYAVFVLATDPGDDGPIWRMLPDPLGYDEIAELTEETARNAWDSDTSRSYAGYLKGERERSLKVAAHYVDVERVPLVFVADGVTCAFLARYVNTEEDPPQVEHIWESQIPTGRRPSNG